MKLGRLLTDLGERSTYDAASQCNRCGYCEQACPTYVVTGREAFSGRGRNQVVRQLLEGKFQDPAGAAEALSTCLLCGACTTACYAHVPTADVVLEGRRQLRGEEPPALVRLLGWLLEKRPGLLAAGLKLAFAAKRLGLGRLASALGLFRLAGLPGLEAAEAHVEEAPAEFLDELLQRELSLSAGDGERGDQATAKWLYFAACGTRYLFPRVGLATVKWLGAALGRGRFAENPCCGLVSFNYGDLEQARRLARRNIENAERLGAAPETPLVGDCSSCVAHLKSYPQLFLDEPGWKARAERFSGAARDAIELAPAAEASCPETVTYHDSCRARNGQGVAEPPRRAVKAACGEGFRELGEAEWCCGGAGAFSFTHPELSDAVLRRKIGNVAASRARVVATSSTSCLIQLAHGLRKYYPDARAVHLSELLVLRPSHSEGKKRSG